MSETMSETEYQSVLYPCMYTSAPFPDVRADRTPFLRSTLLILARRVLHRLRTATSYYLRKVVKTARVCYTTSMLINHSRNFMLASRGAAAVRLWNGATPALRAGPVPRPDLTLYEYEASPWCRRVRETLCILGLEADVRPCPRETMRVEGAYSAASVYKPEVTAAGGRLLFPFLIDRSAGVALNQSATIVEHLWAAYGADVEARPTVDRWLNGRPALDIEKPVLEASLLPKLLDFALLAGPSGLRPWPHCGLLAAPPAKKRPEKQLVLHACEPEPGCRLVREKLCMLQLPYRHIPRPVDAYRTRLEPEGCRASPATPIHTRLRSTADRPLPHLEDPNTGWASFGAAQALQYLEAEYQPGEALPLDAIFAPVPEHNLGDARRSWFSGVFDVVAAAARR